MGTADTVQTNKVFQEKGYAMCDVSYPCTATFTCIYVIEPDGILRLSKQLSEIILQHY